ncbi:MAG: hypothetical protein KME35_06435 [Aphanocapsa sp. GSE-SYN-MK-11-07L]|jgi:hypothetical protein|nr:hypothetical protein [Aphanocapsa sp. GSE-SYN-MK-11-07L]
MLLVNSLRQSLGIILGAGLLLISPQGLAAEVDSASPTLAKASGEVPIVKSAGLRPNLRVPWSRLVNVNDPFEGNFLAVFNRHSLRDAQSRRVISLWNSNSVRVLVTSARQNCNSSGWGFWGSTCWGVTGTAATVERVFVRISDRIFELTGENGKFAVTPELATALTATSEKELTIRLLLQNGETIDSRVDKKTVAVWPTIYQAGDTPSAVSFDTDDSLKGN